MKIIKIYNKNFTKLANFTEPDFTSLTYKRTKGEIGDASFTIRLSRPKMNEVNLNLYNRIEIFEEGDKKFVGIITQKIVKLDTAEIRCRELPFIMKKRIVGTNYTLSGSVDAMITQVIDDMNAVEDTGISIGSLSGIGTVNLTFNNADVWTVIKQICEATGNQFEVNYNRQLVVAPTIGTDKSETVLFRYNVDQVANANMIGFEIEDDGENIFTKVYGKSAALSTDQEDAGLIASYGTLEKFKDFRVVNTLGVLEEFTLAEVSDRLYSPKIVLKPNIEDNFEVGDVVRIRLKNPLVNINAGYQILEKRVKFSGSQKLIEVRINDLPNSLILKLADRDKRLELLEKQV